MWWPRMLIPFNCIFFRGGGSGLCHSCQAKQPSPAVPRKASLEVAFRLIHPCYLRLYLREKKHHLAWVSDSKKLSKTELVRRNMDLFTSWGVRQPQSYPSSGGLALMSLMHLLWSFHCYLLLPHLFVYKIALKLLLLDLDCSCLGQEQFLWCVCTGFSTNVLRPLRNDTWRKEGHWWRVLVFPFL